MQLAAQLYSISYDDL